MPEQERGAEREEHDLHPDVHEAGALDDAQEPFGLPDADDGNEVEEQEEKPKEKTDWRKVLPGIIYSSVLFGLIAYVIIRVINGG